jgi:hypothetical protein
MGLIAYGPLNNKKIQNSLKISMQLVYEVQSQILMQRYTKYTKYTKQQS